MSYDEFVQNENNAMTETTSTSNISDAELVQEYFYARRDAKLPAAVICAVLFVIGLVGNSLVLCVFSCHYKKGNYRSFVLFLALADLFCCLTAIPLEMTRYLYAYPVPTISKTKAFLWTFTIFSKPALLGVIAVDMFRKVCAPLGWQLRPAVATTSCFGVYIVSLLLALPVPIRWSVIQRQVEFKDRNIMVTVCDMDDKYKDPFIDTYIGISLFPMIMVLMGGSMVYVFVLMKLHIWKKEVFRRSMKRKRDACGTEAEIDTCLSNDQPAAGNISYNQEPYIVSDSEQNHVAAEESNRLKKKKLEDKMDMIYWAKPKAVIMSSLTFISLIITFMHMVSPSSESNGIHLSLNFINHVVGPLIYVFLDSDYREGIMQLKTRVTKACCMCVLND